MRARLRWVPSRPTWATSAVWALWWKRNARWKPTWTATWCPCRLQDARSRAIVTQMRDDEAAHGAQAQALGAIEVPAPARAAMTAMAKVMTSTAYYL